jgi:hypothetical protein
MRSRRLDAGVSLLAALLEALWVGALAALLTSSSPAGPVALCFCLIAAATVIADRSRRTVAAAAAAAAAQGREAPPHVAAAPLRHRLALLALGVATAAVLAALTGPHGLRQTADATARAVLLVGVCLELGVLAGRAEVEPDGALRRAVRGFVLVFAVVFVASLARHGLPGAGVLVAAAVLGGTGLIVVARLRSIVAVVDGGGAPTPWIGAVLLVDLLVLTLALLLTAAPLGGALAWLGGPLVLALHGLQDAVAWAAAGIAYVVAWGIATLVAPLHLHLHPHAFRPSLPHPLRTTTPTHGRPDPIVAEVAAACALLAVAALSVWLVARSLRVERHAADDTVVEEHEHLEHEPELRAAGRRLARRLRRLFERDRTPADALRAEYRRLERALHRAGHERAPAWTVRRYLDACLATDDVRDASTLLVGLYERARYDDPARSVGWADVEEFRRARRELRLEPRP